MEEVEEEEVVVCMAKQSSGASSNPRVRYG